MEKTDSTPSQQPQQKMSRFHVEVSKYLSYILRHGAKSEGLKMDSAGFIKIDDILAKPKAKKYKLEDVKFVHDNNEKKRFEMKEVDGALCIRAVQGHTVEGLDMEAIFDEIKDPQEIPLIVHGTDRRAFLDFIRYQGLKRMARNHIHFAIGYNSDNRVISGMRNSCEVIIEVDAEKAMKDGYQFLRSKNDVILCPGKGPEGILPTKYFKKVTVYPKGKQAQPQILIPKEYKTLLILDFEANCVEEGKLDCQEIIEFPVVPVDVSSMTIQHEKTFHYYIKPTVHKKITPFCTSLTGITQETVDKGVELKEALAKFDTWMQDNNYNAEDCIIMTCGAWDLNTCLRAEANYKKIDLPAVLKQFVNVKMIYGAHFPSKKIGMVGMLESLKLKLEGKHHSGIDDTKNIAKIVVELLKKGAFISTFQVEHVK